MSQAGIIGLNAAFFARPAPFVAYDLIGCTLVHRTREGLTCGRIVETEAYTEDDPASHCYRGIKPKNRSMFAAPGTIYVYRSYGIHFCLNISTGQLGRGEGVLIRALQPIKGLALMARRRHIEEHRCALLANGPGKLTEAMGIDLALDGCMLSERGLSIHHRNSDELPPVVGIATRIGITKACERLWRFFDQDSCCAMRPKVAGIRLRGKREKSCRI